MMTKNKFFYFEPFNSHFFLNVNLYSYQPHDETSMVQPETLSMEKTHKALKFIEGFSGQLGDYSFKKENKS